MDISQIPRESLLAVLRAHFADVPDETPDAAVAEAAADQYADRLLEEETCTLTEGGVYSYIPIRLTYEERPWLRLVEAALETSDYTDKVDSVVGSRKFLVTSRQVSALLCGLVTAADPDQGARLAETKDFSEHTEFFNKIFEISRRYKLLNPERMRSSYGKLIYFLQDLLGMPDMLQLELSKVLTVKDVLGGSRVLEDALLEVATNEIVADHKSRYVIDKEIKNKEQAIKVLAKKYSYESGSSGLSGFSKFFGSSSSNGSSNDSRKISEEEIKQSIYSICDYKVFFRFNKEPVDKLLDYLHDYFCADTITRLGDMVTSERSLGIVEGEEGSRLTHSHERQYAFVRQSLTLWKTVLEDIFRLWNLAEQDLLDPANTYVLTETGQGLQRVQKAPRVQTAMNGIVAKVQRELKGWVGSTVVHLGDRNVPNALLFIDKYIQVPRILTPLVLVLEKIHKYQSDPALKMLVDCYGGADAVVKEILRDFFRHAFDGSGGDNFFEAGSCIDGRLTSAWNWCSKIESKPFFPIFLLCGFAGFDGKEGW